MAASKASAKKTTGARNLKSSAKVSMIARVTEMVRLQCEVNDRVNPQWESMHYPWYRCIWTEAGELVTDHYGSWAWWKMKEDNLRQAQLEVIDILHFGISYLAEISRERAVDQLIEGYLMALRESNPRGEIVSLAEVVAADAIRMKSFPITGFWRLAMACGMTFDNVYRTYVEKCTLNLFRQDHGYKDGTYRKVWAGQEDNEHLAQISACIKLSDDFPEKLYRELSQRYIALTPKHARVAKK